MRVTSHETRITALRAILAVLFAAAAPGWRHRKPPSGPPPPPSSHGFPFPGCSQLLTIAHNRQAWLPPGHGCPLFPAMARHVPAMARHVPGFSPSRHGFPALDGSLLHSIAVYCCLLLFIAHYCCLLLTIAVYCSLLLIISVYGPGARVQAPSAGNSCCETNP